MRCPACQQTTSEIATDCACGFSMAALDKMLGIPPALTGTVTDASQNFTRREVRAINREVERLERLFPQLRFAVVTCVVPENCTLPLYTFWLFNRGGLTAATERGSQNRLVMLALDTHMAKAACMIGYGLEAFVSEGRIATALNVAFPLLASDQLGKAAIAFLTEMERQLTECADEIARTFGIGEFEYQGLDHFLDSEETEVAMY